MTGPVIALVTGASRGIGQAIAQALAQPGRLVIGTATTEAGATAITEQFAVAGLSGQGICLDVTDLASVEATIKLILQRYGPIRILVNNAGITQDNLLLRMSPEQWDAVLNTNLSSLYRLSKACLRPMMKLKTGRIINIASVVGSSGNPGQSNYAAAKAGMLGFTRSLACEVASRGITVNAVAPGFIDTDMTNTIFTIKMSTIQIYNEVIYDLFTGEKNLKVKSSPSKGVFIENKTEICIDDEETFYKLLKNFSEFF